MITSLTVVWQKGATAPAGSPPLVTSDELIEWARGDAGQIKVAVVDEAGDPVDLTGRALVLTIKRRPFDVAKVVSRAATITDVAGGLGYFPIENGDTAALSVAAYRFDIVLVDADGRPYHLVNASTFSLLESDYDLGQPVTVPPSQDPLGQGLVGIYSYATRPSAASLTGRLIFNSDDGTLQVSDGVAWRAYTPHQAVQERRGVATFAAVQFVDVAFAASMTAGYLVAIEGVAVAKGDVPIMINPTQRPADAEIGDALNVDGFRLFSSAAFTGKVAWRAYVPQPLP